MCSVLLMTLLIGISYNHFNYNISGEIVTINSYRSSEFIMNDIEKDIKDDNQSEQTDCSSLNLFDSIICKIKSIGNSIIDWIGRLIWAILRVIFYIL